MQSYFSISGVVSTRENEMPTPPMVYVHRTDGFFLFVFVLLHPIKLLSHFDFFFFVLAQARVTLDRNESSEECNRWDMSVLKF